ncbi:MAG: HPr family phosphocarrier protein [Planctomycetales bacterium]|nr:HPr family phosphocarrier protein [Planctomycetales bacterium]
MGEMIARRRVTVNNPQGLHLRPGELFVRLAGQFESQIEVICGDRRVDGKSLIDLCTLGATQGMELEIEANGPDAEAALEALAELVQQASVDDMNAGQE